MDDNSYLTTYEAALAVVATGMKKSRLRLDVLIVNAIFAGILFSTGGMLHVIVQGLMPETYAKNPGVLHLLDGFFYPIGLFYVVVMGADLFNSNILFFSCALSRKAVSIIDLIVSWFVSYWFNLVGNIFVGYIIFHYSKAAFDEDIIMASRDIVTSKASFSFVQTLLKAMAGNFYVCMAIYLQIMVKPLHVKFLMMLLPVFSFVSLGFTHSVADMTVLIIGKINGAPIPMKELVWKVFLPGALGNMIGGSFFGIVICWYLHLYVVERDKKELNLPEYEFRDEQPELNQDSRVVRQKKPIYDEDVVLNETDPEEQYVDEQPELNQDSRVVRRRKRRPHFNGNYVDDVDNEQLLEEKENVSPPESSLSSENGGEQYNPVPLLDKVTTNLSKIKTRNTINSMSSSKSARSPKGLFPVYGMGPPLARERSIADGTNIIYNTNKDNGNDGDAVGDNDDDDNDDDDDDGVNSAEYIGTKLKKMVTNRSFRSRRASDLESEPVRTKSLSGISRIMSNRPTKTTFVQPIDPPTLIKPKDSKNANDDELDIADLEPTTK